MWKCKADSFVAYPVFDGLPEGTIISSHTWTDDDRLIGVSEGGTAFVIKEFQVQVTYPATLGAGQGACPTPSPACPG